MGYNWDSKTERRICYIVWEILQDYRERFKDNRILEDLASDLEDALAYGPEEV